VSENRERILNLPGVVTAIITTLVLVQLGVDRLPDAFVSEVYETFAFIPARLTYAIAPQRVLQSLADGGANGDELAWLLNNAGAAWWTPLTYTLLHGGWTHLAVNGLTLAAFGAPVARRFGPLRFLAFYAACGIAGAAAHLLIHPFDFAPVVGASAAISGTMAAVVRFAFAPGAPLGERIGTMPEDEGGAPPSLASNRRAMFFLATWFGVNLLFGLFPQAAGAPGVIAWEAHMGGFLAGLALFHVFDPRRAALNRAGQNGRSE